MNKASVHITQPGNTTGFGDLLSKTALAGNPLPVIYAVNANIKSDILKFSPTTQIVYRRQSATFNRLPGDFFAGDPVQSATSWLSVVKDKADQNRTLIQNWALNPADWYDPLNEPVIGNTAQAQWLNTWMCTALDIAHVNVFKLAMFSFPTGCPAMDLWTYLFPALRKGKQYGAILSLHEYSIDGTMKNGQPGNVLRYRDVWKLLPVDCQVPIVVSECGAGNGYDTGVHGRAWVDDLMWYNSQTCQDSYLLGFCAFQYGGGESNMVEAVPAYTTAISNFKCGGTPILAESPDNTTTPAAIQIVDSGLHVWMFGNAVPMGRIILKDGVQFAGGQGNLLLYWGKKIYTTNANNEWYVADNATWTRVPGDPRLPITVEGVDVSHYQGTITWSMMKPQKSFAFIKATEGAHIIDSMFAINWSSAKYYNIPRGAYHFYRFSDSPTDQAALFIGALAGDYGELPIVVDVEDEATPANFNSLKSFIDTVQNTTKRKVMIYSAKWWFDKHGPVPDWMKSMDWWIASYTATPVLPIGISSYRFWQYSSSGKVNGIAGNVDLDKFNGSAEDFQAYLQSVSYTPPAPVGNMKSGVGVGNLYPWTDTELNAIQTAKCETVLLLTMPDYNQMRQQVQKLRAKIPGADIVGRLFFPEDGAPYTPQQALAYCLNGLRGMCDEGVREFQAGNEVNITPGGMGWNWQNGSQFAAWLDTLLSLLKTQFPGCKWGYPALSPQPNTVQFFTDSKRVSDKCDWVGVHAYFQSWNGGTYNAIDESGGMAWKSIARLTNKPLYLTEYSCNTSVVPYSDKGKMYKGYIALLKRDGRISKAHSFALSWGRQDDNLEAWVIGDARNKMTDIPKNMV